jgi:hypothetical protein
VRTPDGRALRVLGRWLCRHIAGAQGGVLAGEGHLTLVERVGDVHAWLRQRLS